MILRPAPASATIGRMQPPHHTQRLPVHDRPDVHAAETQQFAAAPGGAEPTRRGRGPVIALIAGLAVVGLLAGLVGLEFGTRNAIENRIRDEITASLGSPAQVELGARPVLLSYLGGDLGSVRITTDGSAAEGATGPAPAIDVTAEGVRSQGTVTSVDSLTGTAFVSEQAMTAAAQQETTADSMLGGLIGVQDIAADPAAGTLRVSISGLAEAVVTPRLTGGALEMEPTQASIFGFQLPTQLLGGTLSMMDSALAELPDGVQLTGVRVVPGGMAVDLAGRDVVLESAG